MAAHSSRESIQHSGGSSRIQRVVGFTSHSYATSSAPTVAAIVEKYINVTGGRDAWIRIKAQHATGSIQFLPMTDIGTFEEFIKPPYKNLMTLKLARAGDITSGFDGETSWVQKGQSEAKISKLSSLAKSRRDYDFLKFLHFFSLYERARVAGREEVEQGEAYVVEATPVGEKHPERLYFDVKSGLLVRRDTSETGKDGALHNDQTFYSDYRSVGEVKVSFYSRVVQENGGVVFKIKGVSNDVAVEDSMFQIPVKN